MEYIKLAHANVTQHTIGSKRNDWIIKANKTHEELGTLPSSLTDKEVFSILHFMRKYELDAFNIGIDFGKKEYKKVFNKENKILEQTNKELSKHNDHLASALENINN